MKDAINTAYNGALLALSLVLVTLINSLPVIVPVAITVWLMS